MNGLTLMEWLNDVDDRYKKEADIFYRKAPGQPRPLRRALQVLGYAAGVAAALAVTVGLLWLGQLQKPPTGPVHAASSSAPSGEPSSPSVREGGLVFAADPVDTPVTLVNSLEVQMGASGTTARPAALFQNLPEVFMDLQAQEWTQTEFKDKDGKQLLAQFNQVNSNGARHFYAEIYRKGSGVILYKDLATATCELAGETFYTCRFSSAGSTKVEDYEAAALLSDGDVVLVHGTSFDPAETQAVVDAMSWLAAQLVLSNQSWAEEPSSSVSVQPQTAEELKDGSAAITEDQDLPSTLTVYRSRFVPGVTESTESLQNALKEEAEAFVSSLGVEEGELTKDYRGIEDKYNPTVLYSTNHFRLRAMPVGITVAYDIKNAFDIALNRPEDLLQDDYVAAALGYLGITDPYLTVQENRSVQGEVISATIRIRPKPENCADAAFLNAFSCVALTIQQDLDSVVLTVRNPANFRVDHEAVTVPYSEAMTSFLAENSSTREADIECVLEYSDSGSNGIFLPYYRIRENREGETVQEVRVLAVDEERSTYKGEGTPAPASIPTPTPAPEEPSELDQEILTRGAAALVTQYLQGRYESENARVPLAELYAENVHVYQSNQDCTLPREDLRYLHVLHKDLDGNRHEGEMIVNRHIAEDVLDILKKLYEADYPIERIRLVDEYDADDEASMEDNNSSSFNFRFISHTTRVSKHGLGLAVDINTLYNPYTKVVDGERIIEPITGEPYLDRSADFPYKIDENDLCYQLFTEHGFEWGGAWEDRKDYQHFEVPDDKIAEWYPENQP